MKNDDNVNPLYIKGKTLKFSDYIKYLNSLFIHDCLNNKLPDNFLHYFTLTRNVHSHNTRGARNQEIPKGSNKTIQPPMESILSYTKLSKTGIIFVILKNTNILSLSDKDFKSTLLTHFFQNYTNT